MTGGIIRADSPKDPQSRPGDGFKYLSLLFSSLAKFYFYQSFFSRLIPRAPWWPAAAQLNSNTSGTTLSLLIVIKENKIKNLLFISVAERISNVLGSGLILGPEASERSRNAVFLTQPAKQEIKSCL